MPSTLLSIAWNLFSQEKRGGLWYIFYTIHLSVEPFPKILADNSPKAINLHTDKHTYTNCLLNISSNRTTLFILGIFFQQISLNLNLNDSAISTAVNLKLSLDPLCVMMCVCHQDINVNTHPLHIKWIERSVISHHHTVHTCCPAGFWASDFHTSMLYAISYSLCICVGLITEVTLYFHIIYTYVCTCVCMYRNNYKGSNAQILYYIIYVCIQSLCRFRWYIHMNIKYICLYVCIVCFWSYYVRVYEYIWARWDRIQLTLYLLLPLYWRRHRQVKNSAWIILSFPCLAPIRNTRYGQVLFYLVSQWNGGFPLSLLSATGDACIHRLSPHCFSEADDCYSDFFVVGLKTITSEGQYSSSGLTKSIEN